MTSLSVACPKCTKRQEVAAASVPPEGLRYGCVFCQTPFLVRAPRPAAPTTAPATSAAPPPVPRTPPPIPTNPPPMPRAAGLSPPGPSRTIFGMPVVNVGVADLPAPRDAVPHPGDLPAPRDAVPHPGDLPAPRDAVPRPGDLPAPREAVPRPGDLPAPRDAMPRPGDLPAPRDAMPRPGDLPAPREAMPRPGDLPVPRDAMPRPDDVVAPLGAVPRSGDLPSPRRSGDLPASVRPGAVTLGIMKTPVPRPIPPSAPAMPPRSPAPPPIALAGGDILLGDLPSAPGTPLEPLELDFPDSEAAPPAGEMSGLDLDLSLGGLGEPVADSAFSPPGADLSSSLDFPDVGSSGAPSLPPLTLASPAQRTAAGTVPSSVPDFGFSLELEGTPAPDAYPTTPTPSVSVEMARASVARMPQPDGVPNLARPKRSGGAQKAGAPRRSLRSVLLALGAGMGFVIVAGAAGFFFVLPRMKAGPSPEAVLGPLVSQIARDHYPAYQQAAQKLMDAAATKPEATELRGAAAELLLLAVLAHPGDRGKISRAEQILGEIPATLANPSGRIKRARALAALARGHGREIEGILGGDLAAPENLVVAGLRRLADGNATVAIEPLHKFSAARPDDLMGGYLYGRALEDGKRGDAARAAYAAVLAKNPDHVGAAIGQLRLSTDPPGTISAAVAALLAKSIAAASPGEIADAHVIAGGAALAIGRNADAVAAFTGAVTADGSNISASLALGEALLFDNRGDEALTRFRAPGPAALRTAAGKFGLGGALIATGKVGEGTALIEQAAAESPTDPRGPYWQGVLAEQKSPVPDLTAAEERYQEALTKDARFVPASLRLAALWQRKGKAAAAIEVLKSAEAAGAPAAGLQIAFGEALIAAKSADKAEAVFRKALAGDAKLGAARLGLAAALEAQGKLGEARTELDKTVAELPDTPGLRERLGQVLVKLGHKDTALAQYQAEIATGKATATLRVAMAKLAIDIGKPELAVAELEKMVVDNPGGPDALFTLGRAREANGDVSHALQDYKRATAFDPSPILHLTYGRALVRAGHEDAALAEFDLAASTLPEARIERGRVLFRRGDLERAVAELEAGTKAAPNNAEAFVLLGAGLDQMGQAARAADAWRTAIRLAPTEPEASYRLGRQEMDHGKLAAALPLLRLAAAKAPDKAPWRMDAYYQLGYAELGAGTRSLAAIALRKYLELAPADAPARPEVDKQLQRLGH